jgi:hypothetical protein
VALGPAVAVSPPGDDVALKPVIGLPPSDAGVAQNTVAEPLPGVAWTSVGAPGTVVVTAAVGMATV